MENPTSNFVQEITRLLTPFESSLAQRKLGKIRLIIHAGTPKTGTTSLQTYLNKKQRKLRGKGILYPHNLERVQNPDAPKHQWFEKNLVTTNLFSLLANFTNIMSQVTDETHTIILSSEGIYNYWWDFPDDSKRILFELSGLFDIYVWVWFREPVAFMESYYKQCIRNPQVASNPCYGKDLSFAEMLNIPWFSRHLDYQGFVSECQTLFGENKVSVFTYNTDVVQQVIQELGLATAHDNPTPRQNISLNSATIRLLRTINQYDIKAKDKALIIPYLKQVNEVMQRYAHATLIDEVSRNKILEMHRPVTHCC